MITQDALILIAQAEDAMQLAKDTFDLYVVDESVPLPDRVDTFGRAPYWLKHPVSMAVYPPSDLIRPLIKPGMVLTEDVLDDLCDSAESDEQLIALCEYILSNRAMSILA